MLFCKAREKTYNPLMDFLDTLIGRPGTIKTYTSVFEHHVKPFINEGKFATNDLAQFASYKIEMGLSPRTVKMAVLLAARYIEWSGKKPVQTKQILTWLQRSHQEEKVKALTRAEAEAILSYCRQRDAALYFPAAVSLYTGMRRGEVFGLQWKDIEKNYITVSRSYNGPTKTGKSRMIPISSKLSVVLEELKKIAWGEHVIPYNLDPSPNLKRACKALGIPKVTFHVFRHTFATVALESGKLNPKEVQEILGHAQLSTTLDIYWSLTRKHINMEIF